MLIIGLTGGLASGKNFVASCFARFKIPIFDADLEVHKLLALDQDIFKQIRQNFPQAIINNKIDRAVLGKSVFEDKQKLQKLEQIIYPHLRNRENLFIKNCRKNRQIIAILNIPLLFEKGGHKRCHKTIAIITPPKTQLHRFQNRLKTKGMKDAELIHSKFNNITKHQTNDLQRKKLADYTIFNGLNKTFTFRQVKDLIVAIHY